MQHHSFFRNLGSLVGAKYITPLTAFIVNLFIPDLVLTLTTISRSDGLGKASLSFSQITLFDRWLSGEAQLALVDLLSESKTLSSSLKKIILEKEKNKYRVRKFSLLFMYKELLKKILLTRSCVLLTYKDLYKFSEQFNQPMKLSCLPKLLILTQVYPHFCSLTKFWRPCRGWCWWPCKMCFLDIIFWAVYFFNRLVLYSPKQ